jgi:hypothetical protein
VDIDGLLQPKYDLPEDIYLQPGGILDNLDKGIVAIQNTTVYSITRRCALVA